MFLSFFVSAKQNTFSQLELQGVYEHLNISTFRSSLMPKRTKDKIYLSQMGLSDPIFLKMDF
jgi:hypothetical protein